MIVFCLYLFFCLWYYFWGDWFWFGWSFCWLYDWDVDGWYFGDIWFGVVEFFVEFGRVDFVGIDVDRWL